MRAVRNTPDGIRVLDVPEPEAAGEVIAVRSASICGSDFGFIQAGSRATLGHELAGLTAGGRAVAVEALFSCGGCAECAAGSYNRCSTLIERVAGLSIDGGMSEWYAVPARHLVPLPGGLDLADASLAEPAAVAWHGLRRAGLTPGQRVAVVGAGGVGLLAAAAAQSMGADSVGLVARHPAQAKAAERLGVPPPEGRYDIVVEAAGSASALARAVDLCAPGGSVVVLGVHGEQLPLPFLPVFLKEVTVRHAIGYSAAGGSRDMAEAAAMLAARPELAAAVITHRFPLEDAAEAFRVAGDRAAGAIKVVLQVP